MFYFFQEIHKYFVTLVKEYFDYYLYDPLHILLLIVHQQRITEDFIEIF